eukprot:scaffold4409_cov369-Prasinococcus_capsulatus_cf.AAC.33
MERGGRQTLGAHGPSKVQRRSIAPINASHMLRWPQKLVGIHVPAKHGALAGTPQPFRHGRYVALIWARWVAVRAGGAPRGGPLCTSTLLRSG